MRLKECCCLFHHKKTLECLYFLWKQQNSLSFLLDIWLFIKSHHSLAHCMLLLVPKGLQSRQGPILENSSTTHNQISRQQCCFLESIAKKSHGSVLSTGVRQHTRNTLKKVMDFKIAIFIKKENYFSQKYLIFFTPNSPVIKALFLINFSPLVHDDLRENVSLKHHRGLSLDTHSVTCVISCIKVGVNPEILKNRKCRNF